MAAAFVSFLVFISLLTCAETLRHRSSANQLRKSAKGDDPAVFYGSHNLWGDNVIFYDTGTFKREDAGEGGTWSNDGATLTLVWEYWGSSTSWTLDGGRSFSKFGFTLESKSSLPSWWLKLFAPAPGQYLSPVPIASEDIIWSSNDALPKSEGSALSDLPDDMDTMEKCREWCATQPTCIGFKAEVVIESGVVKSWEPKKMATGFDPGSAVWIRKEENKTSGAVWQFHWRADLESVRRNDDGVSSSIHCPPGLTQRPDFPFQCWDSAEGLLAFNKDGTVNFEELILQETAKVWRGVSRHPDDPYRPPNDSEAAKELVQDAVLDMVIDKILPDKIKLTAMGLFFLAKLIGHGSGIAAVLSHLGHGLLVYVKATNVPALAPFFLLFKYAYYLDAWRHRLLASNRIVAGFFFKSMCMDEVAFRYGTLRTSEFKPAIEEHCGPKLVEALYTQVPKTLQKMRTMFDYTTAIAWCMRGGADGLGPAYADGVKCSENMLPAFKGADGRTGILTSALILTAMWGALTDDLFIEGSELAVNTKLKIAFGIDYPELDEIAKADSLESVVAQLPTLGPEEKELSCTSLYVTQVAYEKVFARLGKGFELWVRTFGIDDSTWWWGFYHPCGYLFNGWTEEANKTSHMCKQWTSPLGLFGSSSQCFKGRDTALFQKPDE